MGEQATEPTTNERISSSSGIKKIDFSQFINMKDFFVKSGDKSKSMHD